ncbi:MAG: nucleoside triphosphate pyrophosphatase [Gammaproteobacteria bacterium]|nr:nucleoside triphosphate pyrophosphatase [Gammaproteobacteria bacterium]
MRSIILASTSKPRKKLLEQLKIPFQCVVPDVDETPLLHEEPAQLVQRLAKEKASIVAKKYPDSLIIGADQVGLVDDTILSKPLTHDAAVAQLKKMSGKTIRFLVGLCLCDTANDTCQISLESYDIVMRSLTNEMIEKYLQKEDVLNCAGSFKLEGLGIALIEQLRGDDYTMVIGLPLIRLIKMLEKAGVNVLAV